MKNYIETEHYYVDEDGDENWDVLYAVRPSPSRYRFPGREVSEQWGSGWQITPGQGVTVETIEDIESLRKLLDAIEIELKEENQ